MQCSTEEDGQSLLGLDEPFDFEKCLLRLQRAYAARRATAPEIRARLISWTGHASHAKSFRLVRRLLAQHKFLRTKKPAEANDTPDR